MGFGFLFFLHFYSFVIVIIGSFICSIHAALFEIQNSCPYTIWAAANPGGGRELRQGQTWVLNTDPNYNYTGHIWARANCNFQATGTGKCDRGDCYAAPYCFTKNPIPLTVAEYAFDHVNKLEVFHISLMYGFNVPMEFQGNSRGCTKQIKCTGDINGLCPTELRHPDGCHHPCTVFKNAQFCCFSGPLYCTPTVYSRFLKDLCPDAYSFMMDDPTSILNCPTGSNYKVLFCP